MLINNRTAICESNAALNQSAPRTVHEKALPKYGGLPHSVFRVSRPKTIDSAFLFPVPADYFYLSAAEWGMTSGYRHQTEQKNKRDKEEWTAHESTNSHYGAYSWKYLFKTYYRHSSLPHCKSWISLLHLRHSFPMTKVAAPHYATATNCKRQQDIKHITQEKIQTLNFICQDIC